MLTFPNDMICGTMLIKKVNKEFHVNKELYVGTFMYTRMMVSDDGKGFNRKL